MLAALATLLAGCGQPAPAVQTNAVAQSAPARMSIDLQRSWSFKPDPTGHADWSGPALDDRGWDVVDAGDFWQNEGYAGYAGVAWYRRWVNVPAAWQGRPAYLAIGGVNDEYSIYVNGRLAGHVGDFAKRRSAIQRPTATAVEVAPGQRNLIAIQVRSWYNFGGIAHGPVALTTSPRMPRPPIDMARDYAKAHPNGLWPPWMVGQGERWTVVGTPAGGPESLEGPDGRWEPVASSPAISALLADRQTGRLIRPSSSHWSLAEGHLPIVRTDWTSDGTELSTELWRSTQSGDAIWTVSVRNVGATSELSLFVAVQPYQVQPGVAPLYDASFANGAIMVNHEPLLRALQSPSRVLAASGEMGDITELLAGGRPPATTSAKDGAGLASLALRYDLSLAPGASVQLSFAAPTGQTGQSAGELDTSVSRAEVASTWRSLLRIGNIQLPDSRVVDAYYASIAYILMSNDGGALHPGPLLHDAFWYRDSSYMLAALERNGNLAEARQLVNALVRFQEPDGEFPANVSTHQQVGHPRGAPEWDSQGQGIHTLVEYYRFAHDRRWLQSVWPAIRKAARWLNQLRSTQADGLLPPGESAEDLGPADERHYWDDFWGIIGLRDAASAAAVMGDGAAQQEFSGGATGLLSATMSAIQPVLQTDGIIPNSPEDARSPATARGSTPAVWPGQLLPTEEARPIFQRYFDRYVRPYKGGFLHANDNFWPIGGLELAHAALYLGLRDELNTVLDWHLSHQTANGVYAWGDEVSQDGRSLLVGDMPHGWTAAEYASLVRDMLVYESEDRLVLAAGVRSRWLAPGQTVAVNDLPTYFGWISYRLTRAGQALLLDLSTDSPPPGGYDLRLPLRPAQLSIDGSPFTPVAAGVIHLPPSTRHAEVRIAA